MPSRSARRQRPAEKEAGTEASVGACETIAGARNYCERNKPAWRGGAPRAEDEAEDPMTRLGLATLVLLCGVSVATELFAQANQTAPPVPLVAPSLNTTSLTCQINCDTQAMNCQNSCLPTAVATPGAPANTGACNLSCSTQQLVCKQRC
jgi:hypothetical protein